MRTAVPLLLILSVLIVLTGCGDAPTTPGRPTTREALARLVFEALQADDFERLLPALPNAADHLWMVEKVAESASSSQADDMRKIIAEMGGAEPIAERTAKRVQETFTDARAAALEHLTWDKSRFGSVDKELSSIVDMDGIDRADVVFTVEHGGEPMRVLLDHALQVSDGWVVAGRVVFDPDLRSGLPMKKRELALVRLSEVDAAMRIYYLRHRKLPKRVSVLTEIDEDRGSPYLEPGFADPWGNEILIELLSEKEFRLISCGPDGQSYTDDDVVWPLLEDE